MTDKTQPVRTREDQINDSLSRNGFSRFIIHVDEYTKLINEAEQRGYQNRAAEEVSAFKDFVTGMSVSIDVSTGEHDAGNRLFGIVNEVMGAGGAKEDMTLLVQEPKPNFEAQKPIGYLSETAMNEITGGGYEGVSLRANPGSAAYQKAWGKDIPVYTRPANVAEIRGAQIAAGLHNDSCDAVLSEVIARGIYIEELKKVAIAALEWIDSVPEDQRSAFPTMPGFCRDWADNVIKNDGKNYND